ncbi:MAG: branched-chain amino acid ABC transporter permease [Myxococcales bacterium]
MRFFLIQSLNGLALGGLLFLLSSGFSLIFGLMRVANLAHGAFFMLGAYVGLSALRAGLGFFAAVIIGGLAIAILGALLERFLLRKLAGRLLSQVLITLGIAFIIGDASLLVWSGDPMPLPIPDALAGVVRFGSIFFPRYRLAVVGFSVVVLAILWVALERTRVGAMIRAGVDDMEMARGLGIAVPRLFTLVFCLGAALAGMGGVLGGPILSVYPGLDMDMLPLALIVLILGGPGNLLGAFAGSYFIGFLYTFGQALFPDLAYVILFLPMVAALALRPQGLFKMRAA